MHLCLFEDDQVPALRPLVETRAAFDIRLARSTLLERGRSLLDPDRLLLHTRPLVADVTAQAHQDALVNTLPDGADVLFVNGRLVLGRGTVGAQLRAVCREDTPRVLLQNDTLVGAWLPNANTRVPDDLLARPALTAEPLSDLPAIWLDDATLLDRPWNLLDHLRPALTDECAPSHHTSEPASLRNRPQTAVHESVEAIATDRIHLGPGVELRPGALLNAEHGPIHLGPEATIHERAVVRGPCYLGPKTQVKIGANVEGTAAGIWCKIGGEVHDCIFQSYSNKGHAGFLGHAYLGRWCNLGADTNNSNLKNDYGNVSVYAPSSESFVDSGRQFVGLFMGDHSKCGINTMFNTGTVVGTYCNLFGGDFPPRYVPPFSWGGASTGLTTYRLDKALEVAERVMARRDTSLTEADRSLLSTLFDHTRDERKRHHAERPKR